MKEKVVLITGAAAGIGLACAEAFAKAGAITVMADINEPKKQAERLLSAGYHVVSYCCDACRNRSYTHSCARLCRTKYPD